MPGAVRLPPALRKREGVRAAGAADAAQEGQHGEEGVRHQSRWEGRVLRGEGSRVGFQITSIRRG